MVRLARLPTHASDERRVNWGIRDLAGHVVAMSLEAATVNSVQAANPSGIGSYRQAAECVSRSKLPH